MAPATHSAPSPTKVRLCADGCGGVLSSGVRRKYLEGHAPNYPLPIDPADLSETSVVTFWSNVRIADNGMCFAWDGPHTPSGYGKWTDPVTHRRYLVHRLVAALMFGVLPAGVQRNHVCEVSGLGPSCANPWHTWSGSQSENLRHAAGAGLLPRKLSASNVLELRELRRVGRVGRSALAKKFGISEPMVDQILKGRAWIHLLEPGALTYRFYALKGECARGHAFTPENTIVCSNGRRRCRTCKAEYARRKMEQFKAEPARAAAPTRTHCRHGHTLDTANTVTDSYGYPRCRTCQLGWYRAYRARKAA